ncbi:MAG: hypothetical protein PHY47_17615 [Lachnospiraceae bacterium]|nr:hypothetical protein [Lachnospiraceae bacterium]
MELNNIYNFKNPVKHFLNIDGLAFPNNITPMDIASLAWAEPISFRIQKDGDKYRTLKMPNILNLVAAYHHFKNMPNFDSIQAMDITHKRLSANVETGDFASGEYDSQLEGDFNNLCVYDNLIRLDIKEYYGRIYTHKIDFDGHEERYLSNMNCGATNGLLMGNYLSLYFAEKNLTEISRVIQQYITDAGIECEFSYFSDDFYFFCNKEDNEKIIAIFDKAIEAYELERSDKKEVWTYETFNNHNLVARYWKKLIAHCNIRYKPDNDNNKLYFINQMVYRISKLDDDKLKKVFINNIFKIRYFRELELEKFQVKKYDYHQLCFMLKFSPEAMLYATDRFADMQAFDNQKMHRFFEVRYKECLLRNFNEEQLYYFYAISLFQFEDIIQKYSGLVSKSRNQILIAYYWKNNLFSQDEVDYLKTLTEEQYWFQNYHMILYRQELLQDIENSIELFLIPDAVKLVHCNNKQNQLRRRATYLSFYKDNLQAGNPIIRDISDVEQAIIDYLDLRIEESEEAFAEEE